MADYRSLGVKQGDEHVAAIAQHIVKVLSTSENPTDDMIKFLSDLKISMSTSGTAEALGNTNGMSEVDEQLNSLHQKIMNWNSDRSMIWERAADEAAEYVQVIEEIQRLIESLGHLSLNGCRQKDELLQRAHSILQMAMSRLEEEFRHILIENRRHLEPEHLCFRSSDDDMSFVDSIASVDNETSEDTQVRLQKDNNRGLKEFIIDLVHPNVIPDLKCIAGVLFTSDYAAECCQAYVSVRKDALEECLPVLEVQKVSYKDVLQMDWSLLNSKIKKWIRVMKIFVRVYLASEKRLADQVFGVAGSVSQNCFIEASRSLIIQLLRFGEAVAMRNHSPEKICRTLSMYDGLTDLLPDIDALYSDKAGSCVSTEAHKVLSILDESVRRSLNELETAVRTYESSTPFAGGGVHPVTSYVMNYLKALTDYSDTPNCLLKGGGDDHSPSSSNVNMAVKNDSEWSYSSSASPMARYLQSMVSILESSLERKSQLYTDVSLQQFFMMNNICYVAQEVKDSELRTVMGENWIRKHNEKFQQHAVNYERTSWNPVLSFLREEGICNPRSGLVNKAILKVRFQGFNLAFGEIYRTQTVWWIHNDQIRKDLRISISSKILQAYRTFMGRYSNRLAGGRHYDRYIKYSVEDLQMFLLDLFEGSPRSLHRFQSPSPEEEFSRILIENEKPLELEHLPFQSSNDDTSSVDLIASVHDEPSEGAKVRPQRDNRKGSEEYVIDLVHSNVIPDLKRIAEVLFTSVYDAECCQAYVSVRKDALGKCLLVLEVEKLSCGNVLQMDWSSLNSKIKKWIRLMKIFVRVYLASEKRLADQVFGVAGSVSPNCFIEASKSLIILLLRFGKAVAMRNNSPEKICPTLGMCDGLTDLLPDIDALYSDKAGSCVSTEAHEVLSVLGESVRGSLNELKTAARTNDSSTPLAGGGVHPVTSYVMNYLKALTDYSDTLNCLLEGGGDDHSPSSSNVNMAVKNDSEWSSSFSASPMARCLQSIISILESNVEGMSQIYTDVSLQQFFMMSNIFYVAQEVKDSELRTVMGENWIRKHNEKFQQHAVNYERTSWNPVLSFLREEGICNPRSGLVNKTILKERFQGFNLAVEEIYRTQTVWWFHKDQLRKDLSISIPLKILQAYRTFMEKYSSHLAGERHCDRYIKYSVEDLQEFLLDLFEGSPRSLHRSQSPEEEFSRILIENEKPLELEHLPFQSSNDDTSSVDLIASVHDEPSKGTKVRPQRDNMRGSEEYVIDLVYSNVIPDLKRMAVVLFRSGYDAECCQAYVSVRKVALGKCLLVLEVEKLSTEDVLQMDWSALNSKIKKWIRAMKIFVRVYLASEKRLADQVFGVARSVSQNCFIEASKSLIIQVLSFGEAVAMRNHSPEKICPILGMCDGLMDLLPDIDVLYPDKVGSCISTEAHEVLTGLGESVMRTLNQFQNAVKTNELYTPFAGGGVHHLTKYVMKYVKALTDYSESLNFLLEVEGEDHLPSLSNAHTAVDNDDDDDEWNSSPSDSPVARCLQFIISILESNLESKSQLYTDVSRQHFFLMNNICYMIHKVKDSELQPLLGENWMRKQDGKFRHHAVNYERTSWSPVLSFLRHEGIHNPMSGSISKAILKERFQGFNLTFKKIYRTQKTWLIHNDQLRDDLRISVSLKVLLAYRSFLERYSYQLAGRYIKYSAEDLHEFLLDLFEGSTKPLHKSHRR